MAKNRGAAAARFGTARPPLKRGGARRERENKADDDGAFLQLCDWVNAAGFLLMLSAAACATAPAPQIAAPPPGQADLVLPSDRAIDGELRNEQGPSSDMMLADQRQGPIQ